MEHFNALVTRVNDAGDVSSHIELIGLADLPEGDVVVGVAYSTLNYKDGLCLGPGGGGLVRNYPHVGGIDFAGRVEQSSDPRFAPGDAVILTGWRVGEVHWGGYAQKARVKADWLVPMPAGLDAAKAMALGTAGLTAMLALMALERQGLTPDQGPVLITGASGGVGSVATALLANLGYEVAAVTGQADAADYLTDLGAKTIIPRADLSETIKRPLEKEQWAGCIDAVGGPMLARVLGQMKYGGAVAAVGLAGGASLPASVIPFLLRGVSILGIDSVMQPIEARQAAWARLAQEFPFDRTAPMITHAALADVPDLAPKILKGQINGRVLVEVGGCE
ncbi:MAG: MDR family oxidoreductase [Planktomarina sp.]